MKNIILTITILIVVLSGFYFFNLSDDSLENISNNNIIATSTNSTDDATTTESNIYNVGGVEYQLEEETFSTSTIEKLNLETLKKELIFPENNPVEVNKKYETDIKNIISILKNKPENFDAWINLGIYRKNINDFQGAIDAWTNASIIQPKNALPESNMGNLLGYYVKDSINAEIHYLKSIELEPNVGFWYYQTFMFYKEIMKDDAKAKDIIEKGIKNNPNDTELKDILDTL